MTKVKFYTTVGCHLCEDAHLLIDQFVKQGGVIVEMIDIADSDELIDSYGIRIPVIQRHDTDKGESHAVGGRDGSNPGSGVACRL